MQYKRVQIKNKWRNSSTLSCICYIVIKLKVGKSFVSIMPFRWFTHTISSLVAFWMSEKYLTDGTGEGRSRVVYITALLTRECPPPSPSPSPHDCLSKRLCRTTVCVPPSPPPSPHDCPHPCTIPCQNVFVERLFTYKKAVTLNKLHTVTGLSITLASSSSCFPRCPCRKASSPENRYGRFGLRLPISTARMLLSSRQNESRRLRHFFFTSTPNKKKFLEIRHLYWQGCE